MSLLIGALTLGFIFSLIALGVFISFRIFAFPDITADGSSTLGAALAAMLQQRPDGLYVPGGALMFANRKRIVDFALKSRLPSVYNNRAAVDDGGFMSYGADLADSYRRIATYVDKILKGAKPADLPVEQPTKLELVINLKTVKQIGLTIPQKMLTRADKVIR